MHRRLYLNVVATNILSPLPYYTPLIMTTTSTTTAAYPPTAKSRLLILHTDTIDLISVHLDKWPPTDQNSYPPIFTTLLATATLALIPLLANSSPHPTRSTNGDPATTARLFTRACALLHAFAQDMPLARTVLQGIVALAWKLGVEIPREARGYFEGLGSGLGVGEQRGAEPEVVMTGRLDVEDHPVLGGGLPVDFGIVVPPEVRSVVLGLRDVQEEEGNGEVGVMGIDLAGVLGEWAAVVGGL